MSDLPNNPGAWTKESREAINAALALTLEEKTLQAVERSLALLHLVQMRQPFNQDDLRAAQKELRYVRTELLKK